MITLHHGGADAGSLRLLIALEELSITYRLVPVDLVKLEQWQQPYRALSPDGAVPLLRDGALLMDDSAIALLYLAESHSTAGLLPADPGGRYDMQAMIDTLDAALVDAVNLLGWHQTTTEADRNAYLAALGRVSGRPRIAGWSAVWRDAEGDRLARAREKIIDGLTVIEARLSDAPWLAGVRYGVADISAFAATRTMASLIEPALLDERFPRFGAWQRRIAARAAVKLAIEKASRAGADYAPPR